MSARRRRSQLRLLVLTASCTEITDDLSEENRYPDVDEALEEHQTHANESEDL